MTYEPYFSTTYVTLMKQAETCTSRKEAKAIINQATKALNKEHPTKTSYGNQSKN